MSIGLGTPEPTDILQTHSFGDGIATAQPDVRAVLRWLVGLAKMEVDPLSQNLHRERRG